jgi:hypothetical protein
MPTLPLVAICERERAGGKGMKSGTELGSLVLNLVIQSGPFRQQ